MPQLLTFQVPWRGQDDLVPALAALTGLNVYYIQAWHLPELYSSGVRYQLEKRRRDGSHFERWLTAPEVIRLGRADCEDLACYVAAWNRLHGDPDAAAEVIRSSTGFHIICRRGDGSIEDPSRRLGMGA